MSEILPIVEKPIAPVSEVIRFDSFINLIADIVRPQSYKKPWSIKIDHPFGAEIGQDIVGKVKGKNIYKKFFAETIQDSESSYTISYTSDNFLQRTIGYPFIDVQFGQGVPESVQNDFLLNKTAGPTTLENGVVINPANEKLAKEVNEKLKKSRKHLEDGNRILNQEWFASATQTIFDRVITLVTTNRGVQTKGLRVIDHIDNSSEVPLHFRIGTIGEKPIEAKEIFINIQGISILNIRKKRSGKFVVQEYTEYGDSHLHGDSESDVRRVLAYTDAIEYFKKVEQKDFKRLFSK